LAVPKNNTDEAIVAASSHISQFRRELAEAGIGSKQIYIYAKLPEVTRASNEIQKRQLKQRLPNPPKTPKHFSLEEELRRIQNINTTKIPTIQDLADVIMMLSMRPAEVATLCIIHYEPGELNPPEWYKPERAKELLTWIQDAIATRKLRNPVYSINGKRSTG
ncbi:27878_t:CDS:2, partial [Dentiscutata erythropus]